MKASLLSIIIERLLLLGWSLVKMVRLRTDGSKRAEGSSLTFEMTVSGVETMLSGSAAIFTFAVFSILILVDLTLFGVGCGERDGRLDIERTLNVYWSMKSFVQITLNEM